MSELKCPFCQQELVREGSDNYWCKKCNLERYSPALYGSQKLWQELIRTREELHKANAELDYIKEQVEKSNAFIHARIKVAAEQIARGIIAQVKIIKEQKD